jgi:propionate CoA-transferase
MEVNGLAKVISATEAAKLVKNNVTITTSGFVGCSNPEALTSALEKRFILEAAPYGLTLIYCAGQGDGQDRGLNHLAHEGLVKRVVGGHWNLVPKLGKLATENKIEAYNLPQGTLTQLFRSIAGHRPGIITKVGIDTFVDPRIEGGKLNDITKEDLVEVIELGNEEWLWYKPMPVDVGLIRGTSADVKGNISIEHEAVALEILPIAQAVKNSGGIVIVQVERLVEENLHPMNVKVPGILVDYIVVSAPMQHMQTFAEQYNPSFSGETWIPLSTIPPMPLDERKVIARRAAMELFPNALINIGIGMPEGIASIISEEEISDFITLSVEAGPIGGIPASHLSFGASFNPDAILDQPSQFDFYDGGGLDLAFLGLAETDQYGNINVSKFKGRIAGCGGFINITQNAKHVIFCGTFMADGLQVKMADGELTIVTEGRIKKFGHHVEQVTFSGKYAQKLQQTVTYITERAVFKLTSAGLMLTEIAPGINIRNDILNMMDFMPIISPELKTMDNRIFRDGKVGLYQTIAMI